ncbi:MAG: phenylacetate--CoA ligase family protein [Deltaproteobacteria bacterium]|nr:phenylacetate--CoA ligase family protein [Deltaproteobacteria bacterium]
MSLLQPGGPLLRLYNRVPPGVRAWLASAYGLKTWRLRYGGSFSRHLAEFRERDGWSADRLGEWQDARLRDLLRHAVAHVPHYRRLHARGGFPIEEVRTAADLSRLPVLEKDEIRRNPDDFLASTPKRLHQLFTSGTTGTPLKLYRSTETNRAWYACFERRAREWSGVHRGDRLASLGGQLVVPFECDRPPFWVWNAPARQLYMSVYHLSPRFLDSYLDEIVSRRIVHMYGYASAMDALASHALDTGRRDVRLVVATSNAEPLFDHQRDRIGRAFGCDVRDTYGNTELSVAAFECEEHRMHLSMEVGVVEVLAEDARPCAPGEVGDLVCTCLLNFDQVFIRYRHGDRGSTLPESPCRCGRKAPALQSIDGRRDDVLVTPDGRRIGRLDPVFKGGMRLREAQIVQLATDEIQVRVVPAPGYSDEDATMIASRLRDRMGPVKVEVVQVKELERTSNGKLRGVISLLGKTG